MNWVKSIRVESGAWVCFHHPDFRGQQFILQHGDYPDFFRWNGHKDHMGSCRPVGMVSGPLDLVLPAGVTEGQAWSDMGPIGSVAFPVLRSDGAMGSLRWRDVTHNQPLVCVGDGMGTQPASPCTFSCLYFQAHMTQPL